MPDEVVCCLWCGRDTRSRGGVCSRCLTKNHYEEEKGRRGRDYRPDAGSPLEEPEAPDHAEAYHGGSVRDDI